MKNNPYIELTLTIYILENPLYNRQAYSYRMISTNEFRRAQALPHLSKTFLYFFCINYNNETFFLLALLQNCF